MDTIKLTLPTGIVEAINLVPNNNQTVALVNLAVVQRLASLLPSANLSQVKRDLYEKLEGCTNLQSYVDVIKEEVAFHESVNLITSFKMYTSEETEEEVIQYTGEPD